MSRRVRRIIIGAPLLFIVLAIVASIAAHDKEQRGPEAKPLPGAPLQQLGKAQGITIGTALDDGPLRDEPGYRKVIARDFGSITPENAMKWDALEGKRGKLQWDAADRAVDFARDRGIAVRGHTLVWHAQVPGWITDGKLPATELRPVMREHVARTVGRYKGRVKTWDVANEVVADDGSLRRSVWSDTLGPVFVAEAFAAARKADPDARLALNEIGAESLGPKSDTLLRIATQLKRRGLLDEVGFQAHFSLQGVPPTMAKNLRRFAALGLDIAITEADVAIRDGGSEAQLEVQAQIYGDLVKTCRSVERCRSITVWGFTDRHSWIPGNQPGFGRATLLDDELRPKPAYAAFAAALRRP